MQIDGAVALVTGASSGIGYASAVRLAASGARVIAHGRAVGPLTELAERVGAIPIMADLSEQDAPARLAEAALAVTGRVDILVCNPPYVRHHHLGKAEKLRLQTRTRQACGVEIGGLAGLYCHFLGLSHAWLASGAVAIWLVPSEFMDVNYGDAVKRYLLQRVTLLHVHRFDPGADRIEVRLSRAGELASSACDDLIDDLLHPRGAAAHLRGDKDILGLREVLLRADEVIQ